GSARVNGWRDARVLVTGARGFIGTHLCAQLVRAGASLTRVSSRPSAVRDARVWRQNDLQDPGAVRELFSETQPDVVFHLAGHVTGAQQISNVLPTFAANLAATVHVLTAAVETGRGRVVLMGSMQEPDVDGRGDVPCSPYVASKLASSAYGRMFQN